VITSAPALTALTSANCALGYFPSGTTPYKCEECKSSTIYSASTTAVLGKDYIRSCDGTTGGGVLTALTCITGYGTAASAPFLGCYSCDTGAGSLVNTANSNAARYAVTSSTVSSCVITSAPALTALVAANCASGFLPLGTTPFTC